jgi:hypothetical protein
MPKMIKKLYNVQKVSNVAERLRTLDRTKKQQFMQPAHICVPFYKS